MQNFLEFEKYFMSEKPLITVVIPSYNHDGFISSAIESVFKQTYTNFELIIIDDVSTV